VRFRVLGSGSSGNTTLVEAGNTHILIDAGLGSRELAERLITAGVDPAHLDAIVLSHEHQDHAKGAPAFSRKWGVRLMGSRGTYAAAGLGAEEIAGYDVLLPGVPRAVGALTVTAIPLPHDAAQPFAFVVEAEGAAFGHATDFGHLTRALCDAFRPCDAVLIESNYDPAMLRDGEYPWSLKERILGRWGHLSNADTAGWLQREMGDGCRTVVLAHLSRNNNHPELARMAADEALRRRGAASVAVEITGAEGTDWVAVNGQPGARRHGAPCQLSLF
jgi:phosphoribosyl 1,2-cyclic phosphodiesterase